LATGGRVTFDGGDLRQHVAERLDSLAARVGFLGREVFRRGGKEAMGFLDELDVPQLAAGKPRGLPVLNEAQEHGSEDERLVLVAAHGGKLQDGRA